jgi:hypothetical protein
LLASSAQWPGLKDLCGAHDGRRFMTDLADNFLTKVIRASMAMSLEVRVPLIHHRVIEFASRLPKSMLFGNGCE